MAGRTSNSRRSALQKKRFGGYDEFHCLVKLRPKHIEGAGEHAEQVFEIQLRSVIMDSWDTIVHGLEYKAMTGELSRAERRILDSIKGLATTGEVLLEQLQEVNLSRVALDRANLEGVDDLAKIVREYLAEDMTTSTAACDNRDFYPLFMVVQGAGITTIGVLRATLGRLKIREEPNEAYEKWSQGMYPFDSTQLDFILYTVMSRILHEHMGSIWEEVVRLKNGDLLAKVLIPWHPRKLVVWNLNSVLRQIFYLRTEAGITPMSFTGEDSPFREHHMDAGYFLTKPTAERLAALWYASYYGYAPPVPPAMEAPIRAVSDLLRGTADTGISSLDFTIQKHFLLLDNKIASAYSGGESLLDELLDTHQDAWQRGFVQFSLIIAEDVQRTPKIWERPSVETDIAESRWRSLGAAAEKGLYLLVNREVDYCKNGYTGIVTRTADDWHKVLQASIKASWRDKAKDKRRHADVLTTLFNQVQEFDPRSTEVDNLFHGLCLRRLDDMVRVMVDKWRKWRPTAFTGDLNEIIEQTLFDRSMNLLVKYLPTTPSTLHT